MTFADIPDGAGSFTSAGGHIEIRASGVFGVGPSYFGISGGVNDAAVDDADGQVPADEQIECEFAADVGLSGLDVIWTRAVMTITGFQADPGGNTGTYDAETRTWSVWRPWTGGTTVSYRFSNAAASAGRTLTLTALDPNTPGPQMSLVAVYFQEPGAITPDAELLADVTSPAQVMDHFGASMFWTVDPTENWPLESKESLALKLMSQAGGIGLSSLRFDFGGGDTGTGNQTEETWTWRFPEAMRNGPAAAYDWSKRGGQQWFLRRARDMGIEDLTLASISAPHWMTKNGRTFCSNWVGSTNLDPAHIGDYAAYLTDVMIHFRDNEGIRFHHVSPVNEPEWDWESGSQEGDRATAADIATLVTALHSHMETAGLNSHTRILLGEHAQVNSLLDDDLHRQYNGGTWDGGNNARGYGKYREYFKDLLGNPDIAGKIAPVAAYHSYFTDSNTTLASNLRSLLAQNAAERSVGLVQSEYCILGSYGNGRDLQFEPARRVFRVIHKDLTVAGVSGWSWWLALSPHDYKDGLVYTDFDHAGAPTPRLFDSKVMWVLGNFSRFIRPGYTRIGSGGHDELNGLMSSSWRSPDGNTVVMVVGNLSANPLVVALPTVIEGTGGVFHEWELWVTDRGRSLRREAPVKRQATLAPQSVTTFVGRLGFSPFRLTAAISQTPGTPGELTARAAYENGVFIMPQLDPTTEWVFQPADAGPDGNLTDGRYFIRRKSDGFHLTFEGGDAAERPLTFQALQSETVLWDVRKLSGGLCLSHPASGRVLSQGASGLVGRRAGASEVTAIRVDSAATYHWADNLGDSQSITVPAGFDRWLEVEASAGNERAAGRLRVSGQSTGHSIADMPQEILSSPGAPVALRAEPVDAARPWRFRVVPSDRDEVVRSDTGNGLSMRLPVGADSEQWELIEPSGGRVWPAPEPGRICWVRSTTSGLCMMPSGAGTTPGTTIIQTAPSGAASEWVLDTIDASRFRIRHLQSGLVLNISGTTGLPILWPESNAANSRFHLDAIDEDPLALTWSHGLGDQVQQTVSPVSTTTYTVHATKGGETVSARTTVVVRESFVEWSARWFGSNTSPNHEGDDDADGISNTLEYAYGSDPLRPDAGGGWSSIASDGNDFVLNWRKNREALGVWQVEWSDELSVWSGRANPSITLLEDSSENIKIRVSRSGGATLFLRLRFIAS